MVLRARSFLAWRVVGVVGAAPGQINLPQLFSHTGVVLNGGVSELVALCACRSFRLVALEFMDGVGEAAATTPSDGFFLLLCPRCCGVVSDAKVEQRGFVQEYVQTVVCTGDSWKMVHLVLVLWLEVDDSGSLLRRRRAGVPVLKFDGVSGVVLPRSDSFNGNGLSYGKLLWRSEKLMISDGAASSSGEEVICLFFPWWLLRWCRRRWIGVGLSHRFILSFQICKIGVYVLCISSFIYQ